MEYIKDRWYFFCNWYYKFDRFEKGDYYFSEYIDIYGKWSTYGGSSSIKHTMELVDNFEIQQYLPDSHPDKLPIKDDNFDCLLIVLEKLNIR